MADFSKFYRAYKYMQEILEPDFTHKYLQRCMEDSDEGKDVLAGKTNAKVIDMDWVVAFEDALPYIQKAIDEQRRFIKQVENVVRVEKAKKITSDSVKHLSQHTNFIAKVEGDKVTPNKILNIEREESFEIYENRFLFTLIHNALRFVDDKYSNLKNAPTDSYNEVKMNRHLVLNEQVVDLKIEYTNESHETYAEDLDVVDVSTLSDFDRIRRIRQTLNDFLATPLMKALVKCTLVRPPIQQTNLLKKNPNFKKAVELWNFIESYKKPGFEVVGEDYSGKMPEDVQNDMYLALGFDHFMLSISTNPGLRRLLDEKYNEENERLAEEQKKPAEDLRKVLEAQIYARQQEEIDCYLKEIRDREHKIIDLNAEVKNLKMIIDQREQQIQVLKGQVSALHDQVEKLEDELKKTKLKLLEAENKIKEQAELIEQQKAEIARLNEEIEEKNNKIEQLEKQNSELQAEVKSLTEENARLNAKIEEYCAEIASLKETVQNLQEKVLQCENKISELDAKVSEQENVISQQNTKITSLENKNSELETNLDNEIKQHKSDLENQKSKYESELADQKTSYESEISSQKDSYEKQINNLTSLHKSEIDRVKADCKNSVTQANEKAEAEIADAKRECESKLVDFQVAYDKEKKEAESAHGKQLESQRKLYEGKIHSVSKERDKAYAVEERKFKSKLLKLEKQMEADYNKKIREIKTQAAHEVAEAKRSAKQEIRDVKRKARKKMFTEEELRNID